MARQRISEKLRKNTAWSCAALLVATLALSACSEDEDPNTLVYWASNQGSSIEEDRQILAPILERFEEETGIHVELEVIGWPDLLNRIMAATTSGEGPDVVNIGNTWSASLQATGAFLDFTEERLDAIGGRLKFLETSMRSTGAAGQPPVSVPLYGLAYGLFYNRQMFEEAGVEVPTTWEELVEAAHRLTDPAADRYGLTITGASYTENAHFAFILGQQQGGEFFDEEGNPTFATEENVRAVYQYLDLLNQGLATPSSAEHSVTAEAVTDFTAGRAAMLMGQNNVTANIADNGMSEDAYGVAPLPFPAQLPPGGQRINSHVAGINIAVFRDAHEEAALEFVEFLTSREQQITLNQAFGSLPVTHEAAHEPEFSTGNNAVFVDVLMNTAAPMPMVPNESQFETTVGTAMQELIAQIATGDPVTLEEVRQALQDAEQNMTGVGN